MNLRDKKKTEDLKTKLQTRKEKRRIEDGLSKVMTLGASDSEDESAAAWVKKSREQQEAKKKAEKRVGKQEI